MGFVRRISKHPVWATIISAAILGSVSFGWTIFAHFYGITWEFVFAEVATLAEYFRASIQLPRWQIWLWAAVTVVLVALAAASILLRRPSTSSVSNTSNGRATQPCKIEIHTEQVAPYQMTEVQAGRVLSTVRIGIKNSGGKTLSNCKVYIEKISPPASPLVDTVLLLDGSGFHLRHDDPEKLVEIAAHWDHVEQFRFSNPTSGAFFESMQYMDDATKRTFVVRVDALECKRSALFEIWADESRKLHLKFVNYTD
ncbi:hypothetical protein PTE30175_05417 [Pandoraea terrae]|uniref:Uncharacterized protein n=1 Tax=Pandoraea terrae TaxID=1537710 RepID=A0A5E4ZE09_9BURK|nr:hypothetical protein [Pandoraea terrae]VVE59324.1 hypothetical protein PTE30175_05417 [Pandoraea terrae]